MANKHVIRIDDSKTARVVMEIDIDDIRAVEKDERREIESNIKITMM